MRGLRFLELTRKELRGQFYNRLRSEAQLVPPSTINGYIKVYGAYREGNLVGGYIISQLRKPWHLGLIADHGQNTDYKTRFDPTQSLEVSGIWLDSNEQGPQQWYQLLKNITLRCFFKRKQNIVMVCDPSSTVSQTINGAANPSVLYAGKMEPLAGSDIEPQVEIMLFHRWQLLMSLSRQKQLLLSPNRAQSPHKLS